MQFQAFLIVLAFLQLVSAEHCGVTTTYSKDQITAIIQPLLQPRITASREKCKQAITEAVGDLVIQAERLLYGTYTYPATSCRDIKEKLPLFPSKHYWIQDAAGQAIKVYCDMEMSCGGVTGGWMRVADIDMRISSHTCPSGLNTLEEGSKRLCSMNIDEAGCSSATIATHGVQYSHVCGKIIGYQQKTPNAFEPYQFNSNLTIDDVYVVGISLTHGANPREHIWTFAAALHEVLVDHLRFSLCPCTNIYNPITINIPPYVGDDYFCDTGSHDLREFIFYPDDPLWDGEGCGPDSTCCSFNNPPWFSKQLPSPTTEDIEMRLCAAFDRANEDVTFEQVNLYVQ